MVDSVMSSPVVKSFLAGSLSGTCSTILFQPLDLVKTRLQTKTALPIKSGGMTAQFIQVVKNDKIIGLWKGMTPSMMRCVPGVGLYFSSLHSLKGWVGVTSDNPLKPATAALLGVTARTISAGTLIPFTVLKTRYESGVYGYKCIRTAFKTIYMKEGRAGLTCGLGATLLRDAPFSGLYLMFFTQIQQLFPKEVREDAVKGPLSNFTGGLVAGFLASASTQPFDVVKTKMQLYPEKFKNIFQVLVYVHRKYGVKGYFKGLVPRTLRRSLMAAMAWTVYEKLTTKLELK